MNIAQEKYMNEQLGGYLPRIYANLFPLNEKLALGHTTRTSPRKQNLSTIQEKRRHNGGISSGAELFFMIYNSRIIGLVTNV